MKKNLELCIGIIIGILISGTCVYAVDLFAKDISYSPSNNKWNVDNVNDALDSLYNGNNNFVYLNDYQTAKVLPLNYKGTYLEPTLTVDGNTATISCQDTTVLSSQGVVYQEIDNIDEYKYLIVDVKSTSRQIAVGISDNIDNEFTTIKNEIIVNYTSDTIQRTSSTKLYIDVSDLSGTKYLVIVGTYYNCTVSVKAYKY